MDTASGDSMIVRVMIDKKLLGEFKKKAIKAYPSELMNTLWGRVEGDSVIIHHLRDVEQQASNDKVEAFVSDMVSPISQTAEQYLGSLHSHPDCGDPSPSYQDWLNAYNCGERVFGVMSLVKGPSGRFSDALMWNEPRPLIDTIHPRIRKTWKTPKTSYPSARHSQDSPEPVKAPSDVETASTLT